MTFWSVGTTNYDHDRYPHLVEMQRQATLMQENMVALPPWFFRWLRANKAWKAAYVANVRQIIDDPDDHRAINADKRYLRRLLRKNGIEVPSC